MNGGSVQPISLRVAATSSTPSASPCALDVPARCGDPRPMIVLHMISVGFSPPLVWSNASLIAALTASTSWPSMPTEPPITFQPYASKRAAVSSVNQPRTSPSIEMPLWS